MTRLPVPGSDEGQWGQILNDYLAASHKADGTLRDDAVDSSVIASNSITESNLAPDIITKLNTTTPGATGPAGPTGPQGPTGSPGVTGSTGPQGLVGATGAVGLAGQAGATGATGPAGATTIAGISGLQAALDGKETVGSVASHEAASDPHATANYAIMLGGGRRIFVQPTDPGGSASDGDLWIDTA